METCAKQLSTHQRQLDARSQQRHQRQRQVQQQQQLSRGGVSDNEASSVSSCFSSASGESILFTHASEGIGHDGENRLVFSLHVNVKVDSGPPRSRL